MVSVEGYTSVNLNSLLTYSTRDKSHDSLNSAMSLLFLGHCKNGAGSTELVIDLPKGSNGEPELVGIKDKPLSQYTTKIPDEYYVRDTATVSSRVNDPSQGQGQGDMGRNTGVVSSERGTSARDPSANMNAHSDSDSHRNIDVNYNQVVEEMKGNPQRSKGNGDSSAPSSPGVSLLLVCLSCVLASLR